METMKKALIVYHSKTGTTKLFGEEIKDFFNRNHIESKAVSTNDFDYADLIKSEFILFGCWTKGLLICNQHPEKEWVAFIKNIPDLSGKKIGLFITYKIAAGSMFKNMKKCFNGSSENVKIKLKSRNGHLSGINNQELWSFINK